MARLTGNKDTSFVSLLIRRISWAMLFVVAASCSPKDDVVQIRKIVREMAELAEKHDIHGLMNLSTENFIALPGHHDRKETHRIIWLAFRHYGTFTILHHEPTVELLKNGNSAIANLHFLIIKKGQIIPNLKELYENPRRWLEEIGERADLYHLELAFYKKSNIWRVQQARISAFRGLANDLP